MRTHAREFLSCLPSSSETTFRPKSLLVAVLVGLYSIFVLEGALIERNESNELARHCNFTSVEFLPQLLPKLLRVLFIVPAVLRRVLHCPSRIFRVRQRRQALRYRRLKWLQGSHYKVRDKASFLERLFSMLAARRLDLEFSV